MSPQSLQRPTPTPWFLVSAPETRPNVLDRPRLFELISSIVDHYPITVAEAPSGFGKTTALAGWAQSRTTSTAWLTLIPAHRIPAQLLAGILASLTALYPSNAGLKAEAIHLAGQEHPFHSAIESIIVALPPSRTTIILDDAHESSKEALLSIAVPLARYSGGRLRFIISGTRSVSRWLAKELANGMAKSVSPSEFSFSHSEVSLLAEDSKLDAESIHAAGRCIWRETHGWPVAVQLLLQSDYQAAVNLKSPTAPKILTDYIEAEVLGTLPADLRNFLLTATVSDWMSPELAIHLTGDAHSPALLEECRRSGLFLEVTQGDGGETNLRWHSAFAQSCREIAKKIDASRFDEGHRRAAKWLATRYPAKAITHALQVEDSQFGIEMLEDHWLQMVTSGHAPILESQCLQAAADNSKIPSLLYIRACCRDMEGDRTGAEILKARADRALEGLHGPTAERARITRSFADMILLNHPKDLNLALSEVEEILKCAQLKRSLYIHGLFIAGWTHLKLRKDHRHALELLQTAAANAEKSGFETIARRCSATIASALALAGRFTVAKGILDGLFEPADYTPSAWDPFDGHLTLWSSAFIAFWQGDFTTAMRLFKKMNPAGAPISSTGGPARMYFVYAASLSGDPSLLDEAAEMLAGFSSEEEDGLPWPTYKCVATARLHFARGDRTAAVTTLASLPEHPGATTTRAIAASLWRRMGYPERALHTLKQIDQRALVSYSSATVLLTRAAIEWGRGPKQGAHDLLEQCLNVAVPEGITAPFILMDTPVRELMASHAGRGSKHEQFIIARLLADASGTGQVRGPAALLTDRELKVYAFLATTMTAEDIAKALFVSPATVRSHQGSIYRKLGVTNRRDAVRASLQ